MQPTLQRAWSNLVDYYLKCLEIEQTQTLEVQHQQNHALLRYLTDTLISNGAECAEISHPSDRREVRQFLARKGQQEGQTLYYAYPLVIRDGVKIPICYAAEEVVGNSNGDVILARQDCSVVNRRFLRESSDLTESEVADFVRQIGAANNQLAALFPDGAFIPYGMLFRASPDRITANLQWELKWLKNQSTLSPPLVAYLQADPPVARSTDAPSVTVVRSNPAQDKVLRNRFSTLQVVAGPPGTGKTQTIINLIANTVCDQQTVLFVSKNNTAVDNVYDAFLEQKLFPGILRLGNQEARKRAVERVRAVMDQLQEGMPQPEAQAAFDAQGTALNREIARLEEELHEVSILSATVQEMALLLRRVDGDLQERGLYRYATDLAQQITLENAAQFQPPQLVGLRRLVARTAPWSEPPKGFWERLLARLSITRWQQRVTFERALQALALPGCCTVAGEDLHSGGRLDDTYWPTVKAELWQDLYNPPVEELRAPDIVFFTGDLSFSGRKHQFDDVAHFLDELRHRIGAVPIVAVPGNHDLARPQETERARFLWLRFLTDAFCEPEQELLWAEISPLRDALKDLFEPYTAFAQRSIIEPLEQLNATVVQGVLPGDLSVSLSIRDLRLGIVGLNSTWRQFAGGDFERYVTVHPRQLYAVLHNDLDAFRQQHHIRLLLQHHPPEWLENQHEWEGIIEPNFDLTLLGHMHAHDATSVQQNAQGFRRRVQARSLFGIEHYGEGAREDRRFGYSLGRAYLVGDTMQPHVWARTLLERPTWRFGHPADVGYREREGQHLAPFSVPCGLRMSRSARLQRQEPAVTWTILLHDLLTPIDIRKAQEALTPDTAEGHVIRMQWRDGEDRWSSTAREQESMIAALTQDTAKSAARLAVFSLSPIPLTIHLGYCLSSKMEVSTFQYHNHHDRHSWCWPEHSANVDTAITTSGLPSARIPELCEGVIRISLSALIHPEETEAIVPRARFCVDLRVSTPATTWLVTPSQVEAVRRAFRDVLGQLRSLVPQCERLHLFYAGPPPGAIVIGQEMNPRMNPRIVLYEYARSATPRYRAVLTLPLSPEIGESH